MSVIYPYALGTEKPLSLSGTRIVFDGRTYALVREGDKYAVR